MRAWNVGYLVFVAFLIVLTVTLSVLDPSLGRGEPQFSGLYLLMAMLFWLAAFVFFAVNAILAVAALIRGRAAAQPLIGCALPIIVGTVVLWYFNHHG